MNHKHTHMQAATPLKERVDNLKLIRGIGPTIEAQLHKAGISTFARLAVMSPDSVAQLLAGVGGASAQRIAKQEWIRQAHEQMRDTGHTKQPQVNAAPLGRQHYATFTVELLIDKDRSVRRTRMVYVQNGQEQVWADWDEARLLDFMLEGAALRIKRKTLPQEALPDRTAPSNAARKSRPSVIAVPSPNGASPSAGTTRRMAKTSQQPQNSTYKADLRDLQ